MNLFDPTQIPGYTEARDKEQSNRDLAFLDMPIPLCGVIVRQFNLRHLLILCNCENGFVCGKPVPSPEEIVQFLWVVSTGYAMDAKALNKFAKARARLNYAQSIKDVQEYLDRAFQDAPQGSGSRAKQYTADCAWLVEKLAFAYGWDDEAIMQKPLARLWQYNRILTKRDDPKALLFNRSEQIVTKHLRMQMAPKEGN